MCAFHLILSPGIIGCGYFDPCRKFRPEICDMVGNLVSVSRVLWQWTKVTHAAHYRWLTCDGEMAQLLRPLVALAEDPSSVPGTHLVACNCLLTPHRGSGALFWPLQAVHPPHTHIYLHTVHRYTCRQSTGTYKNKYIFTKQTNKFLGYLFSMERALVLKQAFSELIVCEVKFLIIWLWV